MKVLVDPVFHEYLDSILEMCNAPYAVSHDIELVSIEKDIVRMKKVIGPSDKNSNGVAHGATSFGLIDHTFAVISNIKQPSVGLSCNVVYHRPGIGNLIESEARIINESRSLITVDVSVHSDSKLIATATCIGFKTRKE